MMLAEVAVAAAVRGTFTYRVPPSLEQTLVLGHRVSVPFGRSRKATGYVIGFPERAPDGVALRDVLEILDGFPLFTPDVLQLVRWAEDYYLAAPGELHRAALPPGLNARAGAVAPRRRGVEYASPAPGAADALAGLARRARAQHAVLEYLVARGRIPVDELRTAFPAGRTALSALRDKGLASVEIEHPAATGALLSASAAAPVLTPEQSAAVDVLAAALEAGAFATFLLHGVTGSGK